MRVGDREQYLTVSNSVLAIENLTIIEKILLGRIAGFDQYFESKEACAELFGVSVDTIRKAKTKLEREGYIKMVENTGRGKKYTADPKWKIERKTSESPIVTAKNINQTSSKINHPSFTSSTTEKKLVVKKSNKHWDRQHPNLIDSRDKAMEFLRRSGIPVDINALQIGIVNIVSTFPNVNEDYLIDTYIDYLESPEYLYQAKNNQYCPRIRSTSDFCDKFTRIREFKTNKKQHYDPTKNLSNH